MVLKALGAPLRLETVPVPKIGPGDVLIRVRATGVGLTVVLMTAVDPGVMLSEMLEIHGSFPLEGAEEAHELLRQNALVGRAALLL